MNIHLAKAIFINRAPFNKLELDFTENEIAVLTAINGSGKSTFLSHIVDAWYEMARPHFTNEFKYKENEYYRVSSSIYNINQNEPSFVYFRFKIEEDNIDYVDIRHKCTAEQYNRAINIDGKIPFHEINATLDEMNNIKQVSSNFDKKNADKLYLNNLLTYFPSYRFEIPGYINDPYKVKLDFTTSTPFWGHLKNPIEVVTGLPQLANWIMDILLDLRSNQELQTLESVIFNNLNNLITQTLISKKIGPLRFGVGPRGFGSTRIQILNQLTNTKVYPTIFNLSSGESAMLCLFGELLRQADNYRNNISLSEIRGIVLIDEVDKHLHIKLQKEVLPKLFQLFPNVQFILSSHSPFLNIGLAEVASERSKIIDLDNSGISTSPVSNELYKEVYEMMVGENDRFKELYESLKIEINNGTKPLIITEGKTDTQHIKKAKEKLNILDCDIEFHEIPNDWGDSKLKILLDQLSKINQPRKIIGIFDRDTRSIINEIEVDNKSFKDYSNNVYAFCIPVPVGREQYSNISIEFYYQDSALKNKKDGKCLYFDNELNFDKKRNPTSLIENPTDDSEKKICCENIGKLDWIHSKAVFANLIETDLEFSKDINFDNFNLIFDKIKQIIVL